MQLSYLKIEVRSKDEQGHQFIKEEKDEADLKAAGEIDHPLMTDEKDNLLRSKIQSLKSSSPINRKSWSQMKLPNIQILN